MHAGNGYIMFLCNFDFATIQKSGIGILTNHSVAGSRKKENDRLRNANVFDAGTKIGEIGVFEAFCTKNKEKVVYLCLQIRRFVLYKKLTIC